MKDFLNDPTVRSVVQSVGLSGSVDKFTLEPIKVSTTNMSLFDKLEAEGIVQSGSIKGTFDDYVDGMHIQSLLKEMMIKEESEYYEVFTPEEKRQLLYVIF